MNDAIEKSKYNNCALYFTGICDEIAILIPKLYKDGYLKSPFGGHHCNKQYHEFMDLYISYVGDLIDVDGYLAVEFGLQTWSKGYIKGVEAVMEGIKKVFPRVLTYRRCDANEFWKIVSI